MANARLQRLSQAERSERVAPESLNNRPVNNQRGHSPAVPAEELLTRLPQTPPLKATPNTVPVPPTPFVPRQKTTAPRSTQEAVSPSPLQRQPNTPPIAVAARPERPGESRLEGPRRVKRQSPTRPAESPARLATATAPTSTPSRRPQTDVTIPSRVAARPSYPTGALFELTVNGELNDAESAQLQQGIERLTQDYLSLLGIQEEALQFKSAQIQSEMVKLSASGQYRLQIALSPSQTADVPVDVSVIMLKASAPIMPEGETFDPQLLLEEQRLQSNSTRQSLQQDLQAVLQKHARQQQMALKLTPPPSRRSRSAQLPFEILNVVNQNGVIRGELFLR